ncbi:SDR family oxidoreductase [Ciceribacter sp. L1K22]|uniref:SDR family NAD(P)-dependent oxidoreductase n=1 Tax=Ciceribacter sp. L1K22 TaxID=2820275 RepID=UPI001ABE8E21|nr:SDR family oxidoreductase [Ciceribacter sp. L1K22]MBO3758901.1 SDR family oxidoreductase [Ciceribacter sp. L1K22]
MTQPRPATSAYTLGTAIVTGASSGIGRVYSERLAARGHDLILVARRRDRLEALAGELKARFSVNAEVLVADLATQDGVASVEHRLATDASVSLLVNNAGFSALKPLTETPADTIGGMIALNITALTLLSKAALTAFRRRDAGTLVNIGSGAGFSPYPGIPVYGATKAYVFLFTRALQQEVEGTAVRVQLVLPGAVISEGWEVAGGDALEALPESIVMTTEDCVDAALAGLDQGEPITAPSLHDISLLEEYLGLSGRMLESVFDARPAGRYGVGG